MVNIGIDIGTSNTVVAKVNADGIADVYSFENGALVPSVIYVDQIAGRQTVGHQAELEWADPESDPANTFRRWKLLMGENVQLRTIPHGKGAATVVTPEQLTTWLVEHVANAVASGVGGDTVDSVVVTVPHGWRREHSAKCVATREAAGRAVVNGRQLRVHDRAVDEPVAAAAYWLHNVDRTEYLHKTVLVVDIGGGTFDLSLIEVGEPDRPLTVIDAINHNTAGDFVTALLLGEGVSAINEATSSSHPTDPDALLEHLALGQDAWLRQAFLEAQTAVQAQSTAINMTEARGRALSETPRKVTIIGPDGEPAEFPVSAARMVELMEPFYEAGRDLLRKFLNLQTPNLLPHAVMFAGGGSKLGGVESHIVRPVLAELIPDVQPVLDRIKLNVQRVDQAIALGAALIADGRESIEERLLYDIGLAFSAPARLAKHLGLDERDQECIVSPLLARGTVLPAKFSTKTRSFPEITVQQSRKLELDIVVFDDPDDPWARTWEDMHPAEGRVVGVDVEMWANADGVLGVEVVPRSGGAVRMEGQLQRRRKLRESSGLTFANPTQEFSLPPVVTPEQLEQATRKWRLGQ